MEVKRGSVVLFGARLGMSAVGFAATVYFARTLGSTALGVYFTFEALINVLGMLSRFGITAAAEKRISEAAGLNDEYLGGALMLATLPLVAVAGVTLVLSEHVDAYVGIAATFALVVGVFGTNYSALLLSALRGEGKLTHAAGLELLAETIRVVVAVSLILSGVGVIALLYGYIAGMFGRAVVAAGWLDITPTLPSRETVYSLISFSRYALISNVSGLAYSWLDTLLLSYFLTKDVVGVYESAWKISVVALIASTALSTSLFSAFSRWHSEGRTDYIENAITEAITFTLVLVIPAAVGATLLGGEIMNIVYQFSTGGLILAILVSEKLFQAIVQVIQRVLLGIDRPRTVFYVNLAVLGTNAILNVVLIQLFGAIGAAVATLACSLVGLLLSVRLLHPYVRLRPDWRTLSWEAGAALVMGVIVVITNDIVRPSSIPTLAVVVGGGAAVYGALVLMNRQIRNSVVDVLG